MRISLQQRVGRFFRECWSGLADLFYPSLCLVCGKCLVRGEKYLCSHCLADFPFADEAYSASDQVLEVFDHVSRPQCLYALFYYNKYSPYRKLILCCKIFVLPETRKVFGAIAGGADERKMSGRLYCSGSFA